MKSTRFYKILVVVLLVLNITTLFFLLKGPKHHGPPGKNDLVNEIGLSGKTKDKVLSMQEIHFREKQKLIETGRDLHEKLFRSFSDPNKDSSDVRNIIDQIVENQRETEQMTFDYFKQVNALCTPEQQEKLQKLIHEVLRRAGGPPPPPKK
jgi:Spy/CpxP family protein refolding chaperone